MLNASSALHKTCYTLLCATEAAASKSVAEQSSWASSGNFGPACTLDDPDREYVLGE